MTRHNVEALHARAEAVEQRAEALQASLRAEKMDISNLRESCRAGRLEMAELQSQAQDIEARLWEIERHFELGWHSEEIHVTWTQFGKKRTRIQLYTNLDIKKAYIPWRRCLNSLRRRQKTKAIRNFGDGVKTLENISPVAILGENISQEDLNLKFLRCLPSEWNTHVVVWRNKSDLDIMSIDDLYNNFKIVKQDVKRTVTSSSNSNSSSQNMAFVSSPSSTNEVNTANVQVSTANSPISTTADYSENLEQIHEDDLEEIDLKWQLALLSMRARRNRNQDSSRRTVNVEETSSKDMVAIDGAGFDWSFMVDKEVPTNMALMAFSDSEFNKFEFNLATYKRGLASIEEQLVFYKKNEVMFCDQIAILKRDTSFKDSEINALKSEIEKLKKVKESNQIIIENFEISSKSLDKLIESQISDNSRKGVGFVSYNAISPPPTGLFTPPTIDLSNSSLEEFQQPEFEGYGPKASKSVSKDTSNEVKKTSDAPLGEKLVSEKEKKTIFPTKIESAKQQEKPAKKPVKLMPLRPQHVGFGDLPNLTVHQLLSKDKIILMHEADPCNMSYLSDFKEFDEGYVTFGGGAKGGRITSKGTLKTGEGPKWLFDIDSLTKSMNYVPVVAGTNSNDFASSEESNGTRGMTKNTNEHGFISAVYEGKSHEDLHTCLFACFLSQEKPKRISKALSDSAWVEAIALSFMGTMKRRYNVVQLLGFKDPNYPDKVYKVVKALHGLHQAPRTCFKGVIGRTQFLLGFARKQREEGYLTSHDKYVAEILRKEINNRRLSVPRVQIDIIEVKKQTVVATSSTEAEYVAAASCCRQVLWI
ncbi:hypothetical protein Tco_0158758 [Tanacetum coccineum]